MALSDIVNTIFREFKRYTGDGLPGEPTGAPLPVGDPQSGPYNPKKSELRSAFLSILEGLDELSAEAEERLDDFLRRYLGALADDAAATAAAGTPFEGQIYFNTTTGSLRVWHSSAWQDFSFSLADGAATRAKLDPNLSKSLTRSVFEFGAVDPTGTADCSAAFQAAADAGGDIFIPPGTYRLNSTLTISQHNTRLIGAGNGSTILRTYSTGHGISVAANLLYVEMHDFRLLRGNTPTSNAQNGIHTTDLVERMKLFNVNSEGHWHGFRLCPTSYSKLENCFAANCYGDGYRVSNEEMVNRGLQWEIERCFAQTCNGWGIHYVSRYGSSAVVGPLISWWSYANKAGGVFYDGAASTPINGVRVFGGFSGEEGGDSLFINTFGTVEFTVDGFAAEINGTSDCGVDYSTPAPGTGRGITVTANNTAGRIIAAHVMNNSYSGIVSGCPRVTITGCNVRGNGSQGVAGEVFGVYVDGRATIVGNSILGHNKTGGFGIYYNTDNQVIVGNDVSEGNTVPIGGVGTTNSIIRDNLGSNVYAPFDSGWTAGTGTPLKDAWAAYAGQTHGGTYSQGAIQGLDNAVVNSNRRLLAVEQAMRKAKLIN